MVPKEGCHVVRVYFCTLHLECYGLPAKLTVSHGLPEALHCSYLRVQKSARRRAPFLGNHNTFWRSSLPRRALQT